MKPPVMSRVVDEARTLTVSQPGLMRTLMIGLCGVLLVLFVLRPVARQVTATLREPVLLTAGGKGPGALPGQPDRMLEEEPEEAPDDVLPIPTRVRSKILRQHQGIFNHVSEHIRREPAQSTRLLEAWIGSTEDSD
jgi:flagellar M-ring protein FliF